MWKCEKIIIAFADIIKININEKINKKLIN